MMRNILLFFFTLGLAVAPSVLKAQGQDDPFIQNAMKAITKCDYEAIEGLRDVIKASHVPVLVNKWDIEMPRKQKDAFIALLCDQKGELLTPMMEDGLSSNSIETRAYAICILTNNPKLFDNFLGKDGFVDGNKVDKEIEKYRKNKK